MSSLSYTHVQERSARSYLPSVIFREVSLAVDDKEEPQVSLLAWLIY